MDKSKIVFITEGKGSITVKEFKEDLKVHNGVPSQINDLSSYMSLAFIKGIREDFKWYNIIFDKFHVLEKVNEAVDKIARSQKYLLIY